MFPNVVGVPGCYDYIHPLKQRQLKNILEHIGSSIERVYVFGSSVTYSCDIFSDLDICLVGNITNEDLKAVYMASKIPCEPGIYALDVITASCVEYDNDSKSIGNVMNQISKFGIKVYDNSEKGVL